MLRLLFLAGLLAITAAGAGGPAHDDADSAFWNAASVNGPAPGNWEPSADSSTGLARSLTLLGWTAETVDSAGSVGEYIQHAYNPTTAQPALAYRDYTNTKVKYAAWTGSNWVIENVAKGGLGISLAFSPAGTPSVSFVTDYPRGSLVFAKKSGTTWSTQTLESNPAEYTSLAYDASGKPAIAYMGSTKKGWWDLKLARWNGAAWTFQTVESGVVGRYLSMAFDLAGNPAIAYSTDLDGDSYYDTVKFAFWNGSAWVKEIAEGPVRGYGLTPEIKFNPVSGNAAIAHWTSTGPRYAKRENGVWTGVAVETCSRCGIGPSLAFLSSGLPVVGYGSYDPEVKVANFDGTEWNVELVDTVQCHFTDVAVSPSNQITIGYQSDVFPEKDAKFARRN